MTCEECRADDRYGPGRYCALGRCYCGHGTCPAYHTWKPLDDDTLSTPITPRKQSRAAQLWDTRDEDTWLDK